MSSRTRVHVASGSGPLRRTRGDLIATTVIAGVSLVAVGVVWANSESGAAHLTTAPESFVSTTTDASIPFDLHEAWRAADAAVPAQARPVTAAGLVLTAVDGVLTARDPNSGDAVWSYRRDNHPICSLGAAFDRVYATYLTQAGCGDVIGFEASTGEYRAARSSPAPDETVPIRSNDAVGTVSAERVELWRNDLVRTVEYGEVEAKQEPALQPNEDCVIDSALTRTGNLAVVEHCPASDEHGAGYWLRLQKRDPEDSRKPEIIAEAFLGTEKAEIVVIGQNGAGVYLAGSETQPPRIEVYDLEGVQTSVTELPASPLVASVRGVFAPATADLPHHMSWFDGERLYLFHPSTLELKQTFTDALGTGIAVEGRLLYPTADGIAVADWDTGVVERTIPVDRGAYTGPVALAYVGGAGVVLEKRATNGGTLVALVSQTLPPPS
ncbi:MULTISPECIES: PQQ-binding-like beta-propeller repeat protein [unclassified Corynebacterium]|uniref:Rv3212 family protein n=1 Tax=unclassified Corynebacterium TaxID=2624378 RepID=UPI00352586A1